MTSEFNRAETEAICLYAVWDMIDGMVNYALFTKSDRVDGISPRFETEIHARLFVILLGDFLSRPQGFRGKMPFGLDSPPEESGPVEYTYLFYLRKICREPTLGQNISALKEAVEVFEAWLDTEVLFEEVHIPELSKVLNLRLKRIMFLKICGDIAKHNFSRLEANVGRIRKIFKDSGCEIDEQQGYKILPEFKDWFYDNIFFYHSGSIAEMLNNIRWSLYDYLRPVFNAAYVKEDEIKYHFIVPTEVRQPLATRMFWDLMNAVRDKPYFPRFTTNPYLKLRY